MLQRKIAAVLLTSQLFSANLAFSQTSSGTGDVNLFNKMCTDHFMSYLAISNQGQVDKIRSVCKLINSDRALICIEKLAQKLRTLPDDEIFIRCDSTKNLDEVEFLISIANKFQNFSGKEFLNLKHLSKPAELICYNLHLAQYSSYYMEDLPLCAENSCIRGYQHNPYPRNKTELSHAVVNEQSRQLAIKWLKNISRNSLAEKLQTASIADAPREMCKNGRVLFVDPENTKKNIYVIYACKRDLSLYGGAQVLSHEAAHLAGIHDECAAHGIEIMAAKSAGIEPFTNDYDILCDYRWIFDVQRIQRQQQRFPGLKMCEAQ